MTVITMPSSEKKADNVPLVTNMELDPSVAREKDLEAGNVGNDRPNKSKLLVLGVINHSVYSLWALVYVALMALIIIFMMLYGDYIYKTIENAFVEEVESPLQQPEMYYELNQPKAIENLALRDLSQLLGNDDDTFVFKGNFEIDLKDDDYEKIVPVAAPITNGARFIHDFSANVTGIIDIEGKQCFVMPLNHSSVLPPKSLYDLLFKMSSGYYAVDTQTVMHNMRVVKPAIKDISEYGMYIANDCKDFPTFKLEKIVSGVYKRSAPSGKKMFSMSSGKLDSFNIVNYYDVINAQ